MKSEIAVASKLKPPRRAQTMSGLFAIVGPQSA